MKRWLKHATLNKIFLYIPLVLINKYIIYCIGIEISAPCRRKIK